MASGVSYPWMRRGAAPSFGSQEWSPSGERDASCDGPLLFSDLYASASLREMIRLRPKATLSHPGHPWFKSEGSADGGRLSVLWECRSNPPVPIFDDLYRV